MGRPRKKIDAETVEKLAAIHCTMDEIASVVGCSVDTLERRFAEIVKKGRDRGKTSLKRFQWKAAEKESVPMLIWLGKQYLNQKDKSTEEIEAVRSHQPVMAMQPDQLLELIKKAREGK